MAEIRTYAHAKEFLDDNLTALLQHEAVNGLMLGLCLRMSKQPQNEGALFFGFVDEENQIIGSAIQTSPDRSLIIWAESEMEELFAEKLNLYFWEKDMRIPSFLGPKNLAKNLAEKYSSMRKQKVGTLFDQGVYELRELKLPKLSKGKKRFALESDIPFLTNWMVEFMAEAMGNIVSEEEALEQVKEFIAQEVLYVWEDEKPVCMTATSRATINGIAVNYVFTPQDNRGKGYASSLVFKVSEQLLQTYDFCTLFTDLGNPTSNKIYRRMGYKQIANFATVSLEPLS